MEPCMWRYPGVWDRMMMEMLMISQARLGSTSGIVCCAAASLMYKSFVKHRNMYKTKFQAFEVHRNHSPPSLRLTSSFFSVCRPTHRKPLPSMLFHHGIPVSITSENFDSFSNILIVTCCHEFIQTLPLSHAASFAEVGGIVGLWTKTLARLAFDPSHL